MILITQMYVCMYVQIQETNISTITYAATHKIILLLWEIDMIVRADYYNCLTPYIHRPNTILRLPIASDDMTIIQLLQVTISESSYL